MDVNSGTDNLLSRDIGGERLRSAQEILMKCYFNPRPHVEGDLFEKSARLAELISILALAWRATLRLCLLSPFPTHFNPRPRVEGDTEFHHLYCQILYFNPRPRVEGDCKFIQKSALFQEQIQHFKYDFSC